MSELIIPDIEEELISKLEVRAARNGRSVNEEILAILDAASRDEAGPTDLGA